MKPICELCGYEYKEGGQRILGFKECIDGKDHYFCEECLSEIGKKKIMEEDEQ